MSSPFRVLVCGGRDFTDYPFLDGTLSGLLLDHYKFDGTSNSPYGSWYWDLVLIEGEAPGADSLAREWAENNNIPVEKYPANWKKHGRAAGPIRNKQMLVEGKPDLVIAFPGGTGTKNMVELARNAGVPIEEI